jgi:hypothetical protein
MKTNVSFKENPITTTIGLLLILISVLLIILPYFMELKQEVHWGIPSGLGAVGVLFLLAPDKLVSIVVSKSDKI